MYRRKKRELNIFSASVVDLFASGLGVFFIVAILALKNQKKNDSIIQAPNDPSEVSRLEVELKKSLAKNLELQKANLEMGDSKLFLLRKEKDKHQEEIEALKNKNLSYQKQIKKLQNNKKVSPIKSVNIENISKTFVGEHGVGKVWRLDNVRFYPGTDRPIEPYAQVQIEELASYLKQKKTLKVEVSGHIFETKKAIEEGNAQDTSNLSVRRAVYVCNQLGELSVNKDRLKCVGYGADKGLYLTNDEYSKEAQLNRRVEVRILDK